MDINPVGILNAMPVIIPPTFISCKMEFKYKTNKNHKTKGRHLRRKFNSIKRQQNVDIKFIQLSRLIYI